MCARQPGWVVKTKGWESDPNACIYVITQAAVFPARAEGAIGSEDAGGAGGRPESPQSFRSGSQAGGW